MTVEPVVLEGAVVRLEPLSLDHHLLRHAFETLGCIRVEFKTDALNERSRTALLRIGAREEGILRHRMIAPGGRLRDSVYYSIIAPEWPAVKAKNEPSIQAAIHQWTSGADWLAAAR